MFDPPPPGGTGPGLLALVGGSEWSPGCEELDTKLLESSGQSDVLVLPTAAAYWGPEKTVSKARSYFSGLGASVNECMVLRRADAEDPAHAAVVRGARFIYIAGGSVLHLRSVLKSSPVWDAIVAAWLGGAVLAASSAGAMVLGDTMVDPRGGALTLGLGLFDQLAVLPHASTWSEEKMHRTVRLATGGLRIVGIDEATAVVRSKSGEWCRVGQGNVTVWVDGVVRDLAALESTGLESTRLASTMRSQRAPSDSPVR